jgi:spore germination cell wall hydrolase CwlJ-like protein
MYRFVRAAGLAAAAFALNATATLAAPIADQTAATAQADPAAEPGAPANPFASLFRNVVSAIVGSPAEAPAPAVRPLGELVAAYASAIVSDREQDCLANAVYFEARGESIEGQLAVAEVVLNRAASGRYPASICEVVTQPAQFSFIRHGRFPHADKASEAWRKAVAIAHIAHAKLADSLPANVLWYHAAYVSPSWGKRLNRSARIGLHIFYS